MKKSIFCLGLVFGIMVSGASMADILNIPAETNCKSNQYFLNGKCVACQQAATCDGKKMKCLYGSIKSNGFVTCNYAKGLNYSCVNYIVKDGKCANISTMCPNGTTAKADAKGKVTCTKTPTTTTKGVSIKHEEIGRVTDNKVAAQSAVIKVTKEDIGRVMDNKVPAPSKNKPVVKKCKRGSHEGHNWIKKHYKNCVNCVTTNVAAKKCSKNKKAHKHYYCDCDC